MYVSTHIYILLYAGIIDNHALTQVK